MSISKRMVAGLALALVSTAAAADTVSWSGPYAGLSYAANDGTNAYDPSSPMDDDSYNLLGESHSLFGGYNWGNGPWVYGAELAINRGSVHERSSDGTDYPGYKFDTMFDLKARVGYALGKTLVYGTLGYSSGEFTYNGTDHYQSTGCLYGIGADYKVGSRYFVGAELTRRELSNSHPIDSMINTLSVRFGMSF
ncbi:MAG: outer membrane beta-barrel protein [Deltaproteobacteria bacterium]